VLNLKTIQIKFFILRNNKPLLTVSAVAFEQVTNCGNTADTVKLVNPFVDVVVIGPLAVSGVVAPTAYDANWSAPTALPLVNN
jgi:hypothetical protein